MRSPSDDFQTRLTTARTFRTGVEAKIKNLYRFCAPGRETEFDVSSSATARAAQGEAETYHTLGESYAVDLAGDLMTYFTPVEARWFETEILNDFDGQKELEEMALEIVTQREDDLSDMIATSNFYDVAPQVYFEAATHGTTAMWVQQASVSQPIFCECVPPAELLVVPGHLGILDRFREKYVPARSIPSLFINYRDQVDLSDPALDQKIKAKGNLNVKVCWGFWLDWTDPGRPRWKMECTVDSYCITKEPIDLGDMQGGCPLLVGRFNPQPGQPWARGPGLVALNDLRAYDKIAELDLLGLEDAISNTIIYPNDGVLDFSDGLVPGRAYPAGQGFDRNKIFEMTKGKNLQAAWFSEDRLQERIMKAFYQDGPRQRGDTPPTAFQWSDEQRRLQQRLGKPSAPLWSEFVLPFLQRVEYIGVQTGKLEQFMSIGDQNLKVQPVSPLQKAQNRDQIGVSRDNLMFGAQLFQDRLPEVVDMKATLDKHMSASGDRLTVLNKGTPQGAQALPPAPV
jgi:hypothetical protein